jgi:predicted adenine nucleotide alpha hydrolase (AANH) superfamily ATPase
MDPSSSREPRSGDAALPQSFRVRPPDGADRVLLHSCCAPCAAPLMERIVDSGVKLEIYFYNPNIHPQKEYLLRKDENIRYAQKLGIPFTDADYDTQNWFNKTKGHENDPERGERCTLCFDMRFVKTAEYARAKGFGVFTSSLGISRWKDFDQITAAGKRAASAHPGMVYWDLNWRKAGGSQRMIDLAKEETFYQQQYCGCVYSLRDTNRHRQAVGRPQVELGKDFYTAG